MLTAILLTSLVASGKFRKDQIPLFKQVVSFGEPLNEPFHFSAAALECYVCTNQEHNKEKCLNTIKTCEQGEDMCLSEVRWGCKSKQLFGLVKRPRPLKFKIFIVFSWASVPKKVFSKKSINLQW